MYSTHFTKVKYVNIFRHDSRTAYFSSLVIHMSHDLGAVTIFRFLELGLGFGLGLDLDLRSGLGLWLGLVLG